MKITKINRNNWEQLQITIFGSEFSKLIICQTHLCTTWLINERTFDQMHRYKLGNRLIMQVHFHLLWHSGTIQNHPHSHIQNRLLTQNPAQITHPEPLTPVITHIGHIAKEISVVWVHLALTTRQFKEAVVLTNVDHFAA